jgi:4-alpha-glucanotransferase
MSMPAALMQLARQYGIQTSYTDAAGLEREAGLDALLTVLQCLGAPIVRADQASSLLNEQAEATVIEPVLVAWDSALADFDIRLSGPDAAFHIALENGDSRSGPLEIVTTSDGKRGRIAEPLPLGYHRLTVEAGLQRGSAVIISAPSRAYPDGHTRQDAHEWGVFLPLYALRSAELKGIGNFGGLSRLCDWAAELGAAYVGTLPLLATFLDQPFEASPYSPVSRLFWNETYVDVQTALEQMPCAAAAAIFDSPGYKLETARLNDDDLVDHKAAAKLQRLVLQPLAGCFFDQDRTTDTRFQKFLQGSPRVYDYAQFRAACERQRKSWPVWPERMRNGKLGPEDYDAATAEYHVFAQYLASIQLGGIAEQNSAKLYLDLPIGVHPDGYDSWRDRHLFAAGVSAGAPPDAFFTRGQSWGFAPFNPSAMRADGYAYLRAAIQTHLRYAGALRLDHVMALHRLFWVPNQMEPADGIYVRYPAEELYALLCLESVRHEAVIIGEDLGTVPPEVRTGMDRHNIARMFVVQFELRDNHDAPLPDPPAYSVSSLNTHDMPTFEGFRRGLDADLRAELGLMEEGEVEQSRHHRRALLQQLARQLERTGYLHGPAEPETLRDALLAFLAASHARMLLVNLEDLWREERPQNVPGTSTERPNWRRRTRPSLEEIMNSPDVNAVLNRINQIRHDY